MGKKHSKSRIVVSEPQNPVTIPDSNNQPNETTNEAPTLTYELLPYFIDWYDGLMDELLKCGLVCQKQVQQIKSLGDIRSGASQLLDDVNKLSPERKEQFLAALDKTHQSHVTNYIRNNGQRPADDDNWPALRQHARVNHHWSRLLELIDSRNGLCCELLSSQCISFRDKERLDQYEVMEDRNKELLNMMTRKSFKNFKKFIECLEKTNQQHVAALLDPNIAQKVQAIDKEQVDLLTRNFSTLVQLIDLKQTELLNELLSSNVITWYQKDFIESASTASQSNERLLDCLKRGSQRNYDTFIRCLHETGQEHVADLLRGDGVVADIVALTSLSPAEEDAIVEECVTLLRNTSTQTRQQLIDRLLDGLRDNRLIAMQTQHSIKLFFLCESLSGLLHLNELYSTEKLRSIIQELFTVLLKEKQPQLNLRLNSLKWNMSNYNNCMQHLSCSYGLSVFSHIHQLAQLHPLPESTIEPSAISLEMKDRLPHELIELLILKAAGRLFANMTTMTSRADVHTLTTLNSVCRYWWETLTYRQRNNQLLRQFFQQRCSPYRFNPKLIANLSIAGCEIQGIAELDDKLYIVVANSNTIRVRSRARGSFCELQDIELPDVMFPLDIAACRKTRCLYISSIVSSCIWRVNLSSTLNAKSVEKFVSLDYAPWKLSIHASRLFVTDGERPVLYIHSCSDGALLRKMEAIHDFVIDDDEAQPQIARLLPLSVKNAVETTDGRMFVCYGPSYSDDTEYGQGVSEVTGDGHVLRTYEGVTGTNDFNYLTVDSRNHILVCDNGKRQILLLNSELTLQVILTELAGHPQSLCYSEQTGLLYICYFRSPNIEVYKVTID